MPESRPIKYVMDPAKGVGEFPFMTVCEVHRRLFKLLQAAGTLTPEAEALIREAYDLAKRMDRRLRDVSPQYQRNL